MPTRELGASGLVVSRLSLGSWRTYERLSPDDATAVMRAARDAGINFLDDARYDDETGTAPIPTGYSEVLFGELFRAAGWVRDDVVVANKLWWEFWPEQAAADELDASLARMDHVDLIYSLAPPDGLAPEELVESVTGLITAGKARAWGFCNWPAQLAAEVAALCAREGWPPPCAAQLAYSLVQRSPVEDTDMIEALAACGASVVASYVLAGGVLTGKYAKDPDAGRAAGNLDDPRAAAALIVGAHLEQLAASLDRNPATVAIAFTLANPAVASVLFGATRPQQILENVAAVELAPALDDATLARLRDLGP